MRLMKETGSLGGVWFAEKVLISIAASLGFQFVHSTVKD